MVIVKPESTSQFDEQLSQAGNKTVFVDFFADWCGPCKAIAPKYEELSNLYAHALFMKVDVDDLDEIAARYEVTAMPTFICFRKQQKQEEQKGADGKALTDFVKKWAESAGGEDGDGSAEGVPRGQMNLNGFIDVNKSECLNESDDHKLAHLLAKEGCLESDVDEQLLMTIAFNQNVKLHSLKLTAEGPKAPKTVKFFLNMPTTPDFDSAESMTAVQEISLTPEDMNADGLVQLKYVKFQNVQSITIFVKDNQGGEETTQIDKLLFIGSTVSTTNMNDFKRVAGKKGESH